MNPNEITRHIDPTRNGGRPFYMIEGLTFSTRKDALAYIADHADDDPTLGMPGGTHDPDALNCACDACYS